MRTPWGDTEELRARRLRPGRQPLGRERTIANQRRRLLAAMVEATTERGYAATKVADLTRLSSVGTGAFYECFEGKEDCFLTAVDALYGEGMRRVRDGFRGEGSWEERIRAAFRELVDLLVSEPAASRMCLVDVWEAGAAGAERAERGAAGFEALLRQSIACNRARPEMPGSIVAGVVRGIQMLIHDRLRRDAGAEVASVMEELLEWGLGYRPPPVPLRRPRARPVPEPLPPSDPGERVLLALAELVSERGYHAVSVNDLAPRAGTSMRTLYEHFGSKEEAFLACAELARARIGAAVAAAQADADDWPQRIAIGNATLCDCLAAEPAPAEAIVVGVLAAGPRALADRDEAIKVYAAQLRSAAQDIDGVPEIALEAIAFGRYALLQRQIARYGPRSLPGLAPTLTYFALAPILGAGPAAAVANARVPRASATIASRAAAAPIVGASAR